MEKIEYPDLLNFIKIGTEKWRRIKQDFSHDKEMTGFFEKSYLVVMLDHHQLNLQFAGKLYKKTFYLDSSKPAREELNREEFRLQMVKYFENDLKELSLEVRFPYLQMEFISALKGHSEIKDMNNQSPASIHVIIDCLKNKE